MPDFPDRLRELRKTNDVTQVNAANAIGCSNRYYQKVEYGEVKPVYDKIMRLADFFDVSTDYLLGRTDNPKRY